MTKFNGLLKIAGIEKQAFLEGYTRWESAHPLMSAGLSFVPGVGTAMYGADAARDFSQGRILGGLANTVGAAGSLIGLGWLGKGIGMGAKALTAGGRFKGLAAAVPKIQGTLHSADNLGHAFGGWKGMLAAVGGNVASGLIEGNDPARDPATYEATRAAKAVQMGVTPNRYAPLTTGM